MFAEPPVVTTIRPGQPFAPTPPPARADAGRLAAQRAFFDLAAGKAQAPAARAPASAATAPAPAATAPVQRLATAPSAAPAKLLRPGSLLDIRV